MSDELIEQPMPVAVPYQHAVAEPWNACLQIPFGILFAQHERIAGEQRGEGDIVFLGHLVVGCDEIVVFDDLNRKFLIVGRLFGLHGREFFAAAGHRGFSGRGHEVAALRTDIKFEFFHIASYQIVGVLFSGEQIFERHAENAGQLREQGHIRAAEARFP